MKKLISIGVALALLTMVVVPGAVAADPDKYATIPFSIMAEGLRLVGDLLDLEEAKFGFIGYDVGQFMEPIAVFTEGPMAWTVDMLAWGVYVVSVIADPIITNFAPAYDWIVDIFEDLYCQILMDFDTIVCP